jgi:hypothetical protein
MADAIEPTAPSAHRPYFEYRPLLQAPRIASDSRKLILAGVGLIVFYTGWFAVDAILGAPLRATSPGLPAAGFDALPLVPTSLFEGDWRLSDPYRTIMAPFVALFTRGVGLAGWFRSALVALWAAAIWGIVGGAIARIAVVQAAVDQKIGLGTALRFAVGKAGSLIGAPLIPMVAVAILAVGSAVFGLIERIPAGVGGVVAAVLGFVPLLLGLVMALVLVGLALGWPLMHATIAAENEDAPDALSRSYSYVNQRLGRYAAHVVVALAIGSLGLMAVFGFAQVVVGLADWGVALGAPSLDSLGETARSGHLFWERVVGLAVLAWAYSYFWSAASIIYLILRRDVDGTAWHDVYLPEHDADTFIGEPDTEADAKYEAKIR